MGTPAGAIPRTRTELSARDRLGTFNARMGFYRYDYKVAPGLYCVGTPTPESPVIATANYKLTFDVVRQELRDLDAWLLVLDTRGINVWCAAGKKLFSTEELAKRIILARLSEVVSHRHVIVPQLGATGVSAHKLHRLCGFKLTYGPVRATDIKPFLTNNMQADETMRSITFTSWERAELIPVEFWTARKRILLTMAAIFVLSGICGTVFSFSAAWSRGAAAITVGLVGFTTGSALGPLLLPWLPARQFWLKGVIIGLLPGLLTALFFASAIGASGVIATTLFATAISSFMCMNFTGSTPYTSPTGVEKEMRRGIPVQLFMLFMAAILWLASFFPGGAA